VAEARTRRLSIPTVRGYVNLVFLAMQLRQHELVDRVVPEALELFDQYGATIPGYAIELFGARSLFDRGEWKRTLAIVARYNANWASELSLAHCIRGLIAARRGEPGAEELLADAWREILTVPEGSRHGAVRAARIEAAWLRGDHGAARAHLREAIATPEVMRFARSGAEVALWAARYGMSCPAPAAAPPPVALELRGDWRGARRAWRELDAPYEAALAALPGDEPAAREAVATLQQLGAAAAARAFARERAAQGAPAPRGPRRSTRANAAGLTRREQEVLEQLAGGHSNPAIAAALHLSERTVAHHVSAVLGKLGASNRLAAVERGRALGLLAQDGPAREQT
jgi:DNA-binding CsgD family transcriptional regulator